MANVTRSAAPGLGRRVPASVWAAGVRAREEVEAATAEARRVSEEAAAGRERLRLEAVEAGRAEGLGQAAAILVRAAAARDLLLARAGREVGELAIEVARRIVGRELALAPDAVVGLAERALAEARRRRQVTVRVAPADLPRLAVQEPRLACALEHGALSLRGDPALAPGDVIVETEAGRVDARIEAQLAALAEALAEVAP